MNNQLNFINSEEEKWRKKNPHSKKLYETACNVIPSGSTRNYLFYNPYPAYIKRGVGSHVWDVDGNEYIDNFFNATVLICGHNHPKIMKAVEEQLECGTVLGGPTEVEIKLAEILIDRWPSAETVRFAVTGSEAVLQACRVARSYTGKEKIAKFEGSYHGCWDAVDISVYPPFDKMGPPKNPNSVRQHEGIPEGVLKNTITLPFNDIESVNEIIKRHADELAAVIMEPAPNHCSLIPKKGFLKEVREITENYGIILIFDEIINQGVSRGGAQELFGVTPDITTLGKVIGGGFPIGAYVGKKEIMEEVLKMPNFGRARLNFSGTYNAFPISMAAGIATHEVLTKDAYSHMNEFSLKIQTGLNKILNSLDIKAYISGLGRFYDIIWMKEKPINFRSWKKSAPILSIYLNLAMLNRGIYKTGTLSTITSEDDAKKTIKAYEESLIALKPVIKETAPFLIA